MGSPYIGEIRIFAGNFNPVGWAFCDGALLPIAENEALFNLIGTTYGGDGQSTFGLPDLRGRVPIHMGSGGGGTYVIGENGGVENVTLTTQQLPAHNHPPVATNTGQQLSPSSAAYFASSTSSQTGTLIFGPGPAAANLSPASVLPFNSQNQPHDNLQPYECLNFIISLFGVFPTPT
jgi:microcystin-dependent protein